MEYLNIAVEGCCHGELDIIYDTIREAEKRGGPKVDLLLVCGDFECVRTNTDLQCVAVPQKYRKLNTFHQYVTGEKVAYVPTIFIGGNHEASNILHSLYYGGYVAPNIYFMGFAGVVWFGGVRIAGISGIFNQRHYRIGHFELPPYTPDTLRSIYHQRELEVFRMAQITGRVDIFLSHDWPTDIWEYGDKERLLQRKPYFRDEMDSGSMGSPPLMHLLRGLRPSLWFSAHLHVKFAAIYSHEQLLTEDSSGVSDVKGNVQGTDNISRPAEALKPTSTRFLALDKVLPGRDFLQIMKVVKTRTAPNDGNFIQHDPQWVAILRKTHSLLCTSNGPVQMPAVVEAVTQSEINEASDMIRRAYGSMRVPNINTCDLPYGRQLHSEGNPQTDKFLSALGLNHIWTRPCDQHIQNQSNTHGEYSAHPVARGYSNPPPPSAPPPSVPYHAGMNPPPPPMPPPSWTIRHQRQSPPPLNSSYPHDVIDFENDQQFSSNFPPVEGSNTSSFQQLRVVDDNAIDIDDV
mmetsp:Transcript_15811/g.23789  ORF Transcript_15811/g.23789 Transcript_15811/m.23789 type:complete len:517 (+) Transcript_15811:84-1634(+)